jgi:anaerobic C4-dicarboxylate transporter
MAPVIAAVAAGISILTGGAVGATAVALTTIGATLVITPGTNLVVCGRRRELSKDPRR